MDTATSDVDLVDRARNGDRDAVAALYERHRPAARRLAATYPRAGDPDDLVDEAFTRVLGAIGRGGGPDGPMRPYLFVTLRRVAMEAIGRARDQPVAELPEPVAAHAKAPGLDSVDREMIVTAYQSLSPDQQSLLWQTAVEGRPPRELAGTLGVSANAAAAAASRARNRLREAYLQAHVAVAPRPECEPHRSRLGAYVRESLGARNHARTEAHLQGCSSCRDLLGELADVNGMLVRSLVPVFLTTSGAGAGIAASAAGTSAVAGGTAAGGSAATGGAVALLGRRVATKVRSNPGPVVGAAAAVVALSAALASAAIGHDAPTPTAAAANPSESALTEVSAPPDTPSAPPRSTPPPEVTTSTPAPLPTTSVTPSTRAPASTTAVPPATVTAAPPASPAAVPPATAPRRPCNLVEVLLLPLPVVDCYVEPPAPPGEPAASSVPVPHGP